ncbi:MAG: hypothetical protein NVS1B10_04590 [Candidatus Saccharimonadales bacterium]
MGNFYGQKNYRDKMGNGPYTIAQIGCFVTAFSNLLERYGINVDPPSLNRLFTSRNIYLPDPADGAGVKDDLGWSSIAAYDGRIHVSNTGGAGWPEDNNSIVKFEYTGPKTGQRTTHFCLVADHASHTIVDSWDGVVRTPGYYGTPVAWATYTNIVPEAVTPPPAAVTTVAPPKDNSIYTFVKNDTIWSVAIRYGYTAKELMDHNGIDPSQVRDIPIGYVIHFPIAPSVALPNPVNTGYKIELLPEPKHMHVSKSGGAEKWGFGNIKTWKDFVSNGHVAENTNVTIVAIAHVIVGNETAAYYLDSLALGDYAASGKVANTIGFNWHDLTDGEYTPPAPASPPPVVVPVVAPEPQKPAEAPVPEANPNAYKTTYKAFDKPQLFIANTTIMIKELDTRRADHQLLKNQAVRLSGTFIKDNVLYGRPTAGIDKGGYWFAVPMSNVTSEDEVFNTQVDLPTKVAMHNRLSLQEKFLVAIAQLISQYTQLSTTIKKKRN